jgi:hypothetical protein
MLNTNSYLNTMFCLNMMFLFQDELMIFQLLINIANVHHSTKLKSMGGKHFCFQVYRGKSDFIEKQLL